MSTEKKDAKQKRQLVARSCRVDEVRLSFLCRCVEICVCKPRTVKRELQALAKPQDHDVLSIHLNGDFTSTFCLLEYHSCVACDRGGRASYWSDQYGSARYWPDVRIGSAAHTTS